MNEQKTTTESKCKCTSCPSRRKFLERGLQALSTVALTSPALAFLSSCGQTPLSPGSPGTAGGVVVPNNTNNLYTFNFSDYPQLQSAGGTVHVTIAANSGAKDLYITRVDTITVDTVSTICTHAGCTINAYDPSSQQYLCPCHSTVFAANGAVITGPARTPLPSYASTLTSTSIQVTVP